MAEVTYYGADWCVDCRRSKAFMLKHNVEFVENNVEESAELAAKAEEIAKRLTGESGSGGSGSNTKTISPRGSLFHEQRTNQIFVTDIPSKLEEIQQMISKIDIPMRQVLIEARIVEATDTFGRNLG